MARKILKGTEKNDKLTTGLGTDIYVVIFVQNWNVRVFRNQRPNSCATSL